MFRGLSIGRPEERRLQHHERPTSVQDDQVENGVSPSQSHQSRTRRCRLPISDWDGLAGQIPTQNACQFKFFPSVCCEEDLFLFCLAFSYLASWMNWTTTVTWHWTWPSHANWKALRPLWWTTKPTWTWWTRVAGASCIRPSKEVFFFFSKSVSICLPSF